MSTKIHKCDNCFHKDDLKECVGCKSFSNYYPMSPSMAAYVASQKVADAINEGIKDVTGTPRILDSGARQEFGTGAVRDIQEGKGRCDLMPLDVVAEYFEGSYNHNGEGLIFDAIHDFQTTGQTLPLLAALGKFTENRWGEGKTMLLEVAIHFEEGAKKYGENNWQKGIPVKRYIDSAVRHYLKFLRGDKDEPHDRAFCWNIMCAIWTCKHKPELNDYGKTEKENAD